MTFDPELHDELIERYFVGVAPLLAAGYHTSSRSGYVYVRRRELVRAWLGELGGGALLDVGCGTGAMCEVAHAAGCSYLGIDISGEMIAEARAAHGSGRFQIGRAEHLPAADASVDVVLALGVLEYVHPAELPLALAEIARVLRPDGHLATSLLSRTSPLLAARAARIGSDRTSTVRSGRARAAVHAPPARRAAVGGRAHGRTARRIRLRVRARARLPAPPRQMGRSGWATRPTR